MTVEGRVQSLERCDACSLWLLDGPEGWWAPNTTPAHECHQGVKHAPASTSVGGPPQDTTR